MSRKLRPQKKEQVNPAPVGRGRSWRVVLAFVLVYFVAIASFFYLKGAGTGALPLPFRDDPPQVDFTWTPQGEVDLKNMVGHLKMSDDRALDFGTYRMTVLETGATYDLPIQGGVIGRLYDTDLHFSWLAEDSRLVNSGRMTLVFSIADEAGHKTTLTKVVPLANWRQGYLEARPPSQ